MHNGLEMTLMDIDQSVEPCKILCVLYIYVYYDGFDAKILYHI